MLFNGSFTNLLLILNNNFGGPLLVLLKRFKTVESTEAGSDHKIINCIFFYFWSDYNFFKAKFDDNMWVVESK